MNTHSLFKLTFYAIVAVAVVVMGVLFPSLNFKGFAISTLALVLILMMVIPLKWALFASLVYIGFEGFFKIISDYNPLVHIGSDILIILLFLRILAKAFARGNPLPNYFPPLVGLFAFHFVWVLITLFNPYSLGVVPSIAGSKIYITMPLLFFFAYYQCESLEDFHFFIKGFIAVALVHTIFGLYQSMIGPDSVLSLHARYAVQLEKYKNTAFRPFGLTNLPGGPAVYLAPVLPLAIYYSLVKKNVLRLLILGFCTGAMTLVFLCQIRASLLKTLIGISLFVIGYAIVFVSSKKKQSISVGAFVLATLMFAIVVPKIIQFTAAMSEDNQSAIDRSLTLFDVNKIKYARHPAMARFTSYIKDVPFGAGFARVGAAAGAFQSFQDNDPYFKPHHFFADNFWIACLVEVGIPGMVVLTLILFMILFKGWTNLKKLSTDQHKLAGYTLLSILIPMVLGLYAAEGILYNPDASFFWFLSGVLLKVPKMEQTHLGIDENFSISSDSDF